MLSCRVHGILDTADSVLTGGRDSDSKTKNPKQGAEPATKAGGPKEPIRSDESKTNTPKQSVNRRISQQGIWTEESKAMNLKQTFLKQDKQTADIVIKQAYSTKQTAAIQLK